MILIEISKTQIERAKELYSFGSLNNSITKGKSNVFGAMGEIVVFDFFTGRGLNTEMKPTYDYDLIIEGHKVDVKTKRTTVTPRESYLCSISAFNTKQKCDFYFFTRVSEDLKTAYLLGFKRKIEFFDEAIFAKKGSLDVNGWAFKSDCFNLKIEHLQKFKKPPT